MASRQWCPLLVVVVAVILVSCVGCDGRLEYTDVGQDFTSEPPWKTRFNKLRGKYLWERNAKEALEIYNRDLAERTYQTMLITWDFITNMTEHNSKRLTDWEVSEAKWLLDQQKELNNYYRYREMFHNKTVVRMLEKIAVSGSAPDINNPGYLSLKYNLSHTMEQVYSSAKVNQKPLDPDLNHIMATSRNHSELLEVWQGWRDVSGRQIRDDFDEFISLLNAGAKEHSFEDYGHYLRLDSFEVDDVEEMVDALYTDIQPLYEQLHAYVRRKLIQQYPDLNIQPDGPIPAHLLGNMWAQEWQGIYDLVVPYPDVPGIDVTPTMQEQNWETIRMFSVAEEFFTSLGLEPMTESFWRKSMFERPEDREVMCHASAEDFMHSDDFRIKMCATVDQDSLQTIHHEMGHIEYFMLYQDQPTVFRTGANSAFHEAVGDTIALSVMTPKHLKTIGLLPRQTQNADLERKQTLNFLMKMALEKIAFLPFGLLMDKYRWAVYREEIDNRNYNQKWWEYRYQYQGLEPPVYRSEDDFDPGAKFHIAANVPYIRYFLSFISQFQFHKALCEAADHTGPLHQCDIYRSRRAGRLLREGLSLGSSMEWRYVMEIMTGSQSVDASAIEEYFRPLMDWLAVQNAGETLGWGSGGRAQPDSREYDHVEQHGTPRI